MAQHDLLRAVRQEYLWDAVQARTAATLKRLLEVFMEHRRDEFLACRSHQRSEARRGYRNGFYDRRLDTLHGSLSLRVPRVRDAQEPFDVLVMDAYQRRQADVDRAVLRWVASGQSTREVSGTLEEAFGGLLSAGGVSAVVARLDEEIRSFHSRPLTHGYHFLYLDAKHWYVSRLRRRRGSSRGQPTGRGRRRKAALLLAWGVRHDGAEELADFRVADSESQECWTGFLSDLERRGVRRRNPWNQTLDMIITDGDAGLRSALLTVYPTVPKQRCIFHKVQDIADHLREHANRGAILASAAAIYDGLRTPYQALHRLKRWVDHWRERAPEAVKNFAYEFEDTLTYLNAPCEWQRRVKTTNPLERLIRELNKKTRKAGIWPSAKSWERATYLVWRKLQTQGYAPTTRRAPPPFTQTS